MRNLAVSFNSLNINLEIKNPILVCLLLENRCDSPDHFNWTN